MADSCSDDEAGGAALTFPRTQPRRCAKPLDTPDSQEYFENDGGSGGCAGGGAAAAMRRLSGAFGGLSTGAPTPPRAALRPTQPSAAAGWATTELQTPPSCSPGPQPMGLWHSDMDILGRSHNRRQQRAAGTEGADVTFDVAAASDYDENGSEGGSPMPAALGWGGLAAVAPLQAASVGAGGPGVFTPGAANSGGGWSEGPVAAEEDSPGMGALSPVTLRMGGAESPTRRIDSVDTPDSFGTVSPDAAASHAASMSPCGDAESPAATPPAQSPEIASPGADSPAADSPAADSPVSLPALSPAAVTPTATSPDAASFGTASPGDLSSPGNSASPAAATPTGGASWAFGPHADSAGSPGSAADFYSPCSSQETRGTAAYTADEETEEDKGDDADSSSADAAAATLLLSALSLGEPAASLHAAEQLPAASPAGDGSGSCGASTHNWTWETAAAEASAAPQSPGAADLLTAAAAVAMSVSVALHIAEGVAEAWEERAAGEAEGSDREEAGAAVWMSVDETAAGAPDDDQRLTAHLTEGDGSGAGLQGSCGGSVGVTEAMDDEPAAMSAAAPSPGAGSNGGEHAPSGGDSSSPVSLLAAGPGVFRSPEVPSYEMQAASPAAATPPSPVPVASPAAAASPQSPLGTPLAAAAVVEAAAATPAVLLLDPYTPWLRTSTKPPRRFRFDDASSIGDAGDGGVTPSDGGSLYSGSCSSVSLALSSPTPSPCGALFGGAAAGSGGAVAHAGDEGACCRSPSLEPSMMEQQQQQEQQESPLAMDIAAASPAAAPVTAAGAAETPDSWQPQTTARRQRGTRARIVLSDSESDAPGAASDVGDSNESDACDLGAPQATTAAAAAATAAAAAASPCPGSSPAPAVAGAAAAGGLGEFGETPDSWQPTTARRQRGGRGARTLLSDSDDESSGGGNERGLPASTAATAEEEEEEEEEEVSPDGLSGDLRRRSAAAGGGASCHRGLAGRLFEEEAEEEGQEEGEEEEEGEEGSEEEEENDSFIVDDEDSISVASGSSDGGSSSSGSASWRGSVSDDAASSSDGDSNGSGSRRSGSGRGWTPPYSPPPEKSSRGGGAVGSSVLVTPAGGRGGKRAAAVAPATVQRQFIRRRQALAAELYAEWNEVVFDGLLPADLPLVWNARLLTSAGRVVDDGSRNTEKMARGDRIPCKLELSPKVLDTEARLRNTLSHEMCHVASWAISREFKSHHGADFKQWARRFEARVPGIRITTTHSYEIFHPHRWRCANPGCAKEYGRHGKTIDPARHACGACRGRLVYLGRFGRDGRPQHTPAPIKGASSSSSAAAASAAFGAGFGVGGAGAGASPKVSTAAASRAGGGGGGGNAYNTFVKERFAAVRASLPRGTPQKDVMKRLAEAWKEEKAARAATAAVGGVAAAAAAAVGGGGAGGTAVGAAGGAGSVANEAAASAASEEAARAGDTEAGRASSDEGDDMASLIRRLQL